MSKSHGERAMYKAEEEEEDEGEEEGERVMRDYDRAIV